MARNAIAVVNRLCECARVVSHLLWLMKVNQASLISCLRCVGKPIPLHQSVVGFVIESAHASHTKQSSGGTATYNSQTEHDTAKKKSKKKIKCSRISHWIKSRIDLSCARAHTHEADKSNKKWFTIENCAFVSVSHLKKWTWTDTAKTK